MTRLVLISSPDPIEYKIEGEVFTIGRLPENDLILAEPGGSDHHAEIRLDAGRRRIVDRTGAGRVRVNHLPVSNEWLASGDVIEIGDNQLLFDERDATPSGGPRDWRKTDLDRIEVPLASLVPDPSPRDPEPPPGDGPDIERLFNVEGVESVGSIDYDQLIADVQPDRLHLLYQAAHVLASSSNLEHAFDMVLALIFQATAADRGVIFVINAASELKPVRARHRHQVSTLNLEVIRAVVRRAVQNRLAILCADSCYVPDHEEAPPPADPDEPKIISALCVPIESGHHVAGAIYLDHLSAAGAFSAEDAEIIGAVAELLALALERETVNRRLQETLLFQSALERFHSPDVARLILDQVRQDKGFENLFKEREATILFTDISGFTKLIEKIPPREAAEFLNRFYDEISAIVFKYKGTVDKFIGDAVMATFGAPISYGNDAELALFAAIEIIRRTSEFQPAPPSRLRFQVRIGVNTGMVISGYVGSRRRLDYTVLGDPVNVAARLTDLAQPGTVLVGEETYAKARGIFSFKHRGATLLKGKKSEINVYEVSF